jgi:hypothetical protein
MPTNDYREVCVGITALKALSRPACKIRVKTCYSAESPTRGKDTIGALAHVKPFRRPT